MDVVGLVFGVGYGFWWVFVGGFGVWCGVSYCGGVEERKTWWLEFWVLLEFWIGYLVLFGFESVAVLVVVDATSCSVVMVGYWERHTKIKRK